MVWPCGRVERRVDTDQGRPCTVQRRVPRTESSPHVHQRRRRPCRELYHQHGTRHRGVQADARPPSLQDLFVALLRPVVLLARPEDSGRPILQASAATSRAAHLVGADQPFFFDPDNCTSIDRLPLEHGLRPIGRPPPLPLGIAIVAAPGGAEDGEHLGLEQRDRRHHRA